MKRRSKLLLVAGAVLLLPALLLAAYLALVPRLPTGYERVAAQWAADQRALGVDAAPTAETDGTTETSRTHPAPADTATTHPQVTTTAPDVTTTAPSAAMASVPTTGTQPGETPRQAFERFWAALAEAARSHQEQGGTYQPPVLGQFVRPDMFQWFHNASSSHPYSIDFSGAYLTAEEARALDRLQQGSAEWQALMRKYFEKIRADFEKQTGVGADAVQPVSEPVSRAGLPLLVKAVLQFAPKPFLMELLRLPDGSVPHFPSERVRAGLTTDDKGWTDYNSLWLAPVQTYLYMLATDPGYDAANGLRRVLELCRYIRLCAYPNNYVCNMLSGSVGPDLGISRMLSLMARTDGLSSSSLRRLSTELLRLADEDSTQTTMQAGQDRRYEAAITRQMLLRDLDGVLRHQQTINTNTFSYLFDGKPAGWWFRANANSLRFRIDRLAVALAQGTGIVSADVELQLAMKLANWTNTPLKYYIDDPANVRDKTRIALDAALEMAIHAYRRANGRLPERVADLFPDFLPESARPAIERDMWMFVPQDKQTVLWRVAIHRVTEQEYKRRYDEEVFMKKISHYEQTQGRPLNKDERAEMDQVLERARQLRAGGALLNVTAVCVF